MEARSEEGRHVWDSWLRGCSGKHTFRKILHRALLLMSEECCEGSKGHFEYLPPRLTCLDHLCSSVQRQGPERAGCEQKSHQWISLSVIHSWRGQLEEVGLRRLVLAGVACPSLVFSLDLFLPLLPACHKVSRFPLPSSPAWSQLSMDRHL